MITFNQLATYLPAGAIEYVGNNQVKLNFSVLSGSTISLDSSPLKGLVVLMEGLVKMNDTINAQRAAATPPMAPITLASKTLQGTVEVPQLKFDVLLNSNQDLINNLIDPTV